MGKLGNNDVMVPRLVLLSRKGAKGFDIPVSVDVPDRGNGTKRLLKESRVRPTVNGHEWVELPDDDGSSNLLFVAIAPVDLAGGAKCLLAVLWARGDTRSAAQQDVADICDSLKRLNLSRKDWRCGWSGNTWRITQLESDVSVIGLQVKALLDTLSWRERLPADVGDPLPPPTGLYIVGESL